MSELPRRWTERERALRDYHNEIQFLQRRIDSLQREVASAIEHQSNLLAIVSDLEGENRMDYDEALNDAGRY